jgi:hypothetical protein
VAVLRGVVEQGHSVAVRDHQVTLRLHEEGELLELALLAGLEVPGHCRFSLSASP